MDKRIHVAVGVIYNSERNKVLISRRTAKQHLAGFWEFPGGKIKEDEDISSALYRELKEELGINVTKANQLTIIKYDYPDKKVLLDVWEVSEWSGDPQSQESQELAWADVNGLSSFDFLEANKHIIQTIQLHPLYVLSQPSYEDISCLFNIAEECFTSGIKLFQLRLKSIPESELSTIVEKVYILAKKHNVKLIFNGKPEDVHTFKIDGIHLNSKELKKYRSRPISEELILGASCHNEEELLKAETINVNYALLSPIFKTGSHPHQDAMGWEKFNELRKKVKFPVYALGGMSPADLKTANSYNAHGVAMISAIWKSPVSISELLNS